MKWSIIQENINSLKKNQNRLAFGHLKWNNLQYQRNSAENQIFYSIPVIITQKVLKLPISNGNHWKAKTISFPKIAFCDLYLKYFLHNCDRWAEISPIVNATSAECF